MLEERHFQCNISFVINICPALSSYLLDGMFNITQKNTEYLSFEKLVGQNDIISLKNKLLYQ